MELKHVSFCMILLQWDNMIIPYVFILIVDWRSDDNYCNYSWLWVQN